MSSGSKNFNAHSKAAPSVEEMDAFVDSGLDKDFRYIRQFIDKYGQEYIDKPGSCKAHGAANR